MRLVQFSDIWYGQNFFAVTVTEKFIFILAVSNVTAILRSGNWKVTELHDCDLTVSFV